MVWPWPKGFPAIYSTVTVDQVMAHPDFRAAKHGDREAAARLADAIADRAVMVEVGRRYPGAGLVVVASADDEGNQIPLAFAALFARESGLQLQLGVVKVNRPAHTGRGAAYRFAHRAEYAGVLRPGRNYILLDDVATQGGTISELRQWVYRQRAAVAAIATLAYTPGRKATVSDGRTLAPSQSTLAKLHAAHGIANVGAMLSSLGIYEGNVYCLTESEALLIAQSPTLPAFVDRIRNEQQAMPGLPEPAAAANRRGLAVR